MSDEELEELLAIARTKNAGKGVTGLLLYAEGNFLQILEGERVQVEALYAHIAGDPRHYGVVRLMRREVARRSFSDWRMGYRKINRSELEAHVPGFSDVLMAADNGGDLKEQVSRDIWSLLMSFRVVTRV